LCIVLGVAQNYLIPNGIYGSTNWNSSDLTIHWKRISLKNSALMPGTEPKNNPTDCFNNRILLKPINFEFERTISKKACLSYIELLQFIYYINFTRIKKVAV